MWHFYYLVLLCWRIILSMYSLLGNVTSEWFLHPARVLPLSQVSRNESCIQSTSRKTSTYTPTQKKRGFHVGEEKSSWVLTWFWRQKIILPVPFIMEFLNMPTLIPISILPPWYLVCFPRGSVRAKEEHMVTIITHQKGRHGQKGTLMFKPPVSSTEHCFSPGRKGYGPTATLAMHKIHKTI